MDIPEDFYDLKPEDLAVVKRSVDARNKVGEGT
jgi:hypothetical protein